MFEFKKESTSLNKRPIKSTNIWKILTVEDDLDYQNSLVASLEQLDLPVNTELEVLTASSAFEALSYLNANNDIGLVLLDVVMEADDTGLQLVNVIREDINNSAIRIVLLTGQPGFAPLKEVMTRYDIDEYWNKVDISIEKLQSVITSNFRTYHYIIELAEAKRGLSLVVDAARRINNQYEIDSFTNTVLEEIGRIIGVMDGGLFCMSTNDAFLEQADVVCATGCYEHLRGLNCSHEQLEPLRDTLNKASKAKTHIIQPQQSTLFFNTDKIDSKQYVLLVNSKASISNSDINLLRVFCENISSGFNSIALLNKVTELAFKHIDLDIPNLNWMQQELEKMSQEEWKQTRLLMIEIHNFDEMKFSFGYEFVRNAFILAHKHLRNIFPTGTRIALTGHKHFCLLINKNFKISDQLIQTLTRNKIRLESVDHFVPATMLNMELREVKRETSHHIFSTGEALLKQAILNNQHYVIHTQDKTDELDYRYQLLQELREAINKKSISIALQPKVCLQTNDITGFEALARWQRKDGSFVPPDLFISVAEASGLILELDCMIVEKSISAISVLAKNGYNIPIAFNASAFDLVHSIYLDCVLKNLEVYGVSPSLVEIEITETEAMTNYDLIRKSLSKFVDAGIKISIDDFGTGYSSLSRISQLIADCIKIDRCFVSELENNQSSQHLVKMILELAKKFNFNVVSEGIETEQQKNWLKEAGCSVGQGYLFAKPMPIEATLEWLNKRKAD